ncbi:uncharacterized protein N7503_004428 [Penicillium pulvis]|uniref:uncharacterized protein n=1 Tax=Penicillium pulvis TaxID=1562058 RepID=UPI0025474630|nr:uncharacterized protein N7503_004428 [Penicillium pulvis]KAJ5801978.1 hypothetical protein N7503_004428 [Penicillium pulvis]
MNSTESLYQSCVIDTLPTDKDVINDFGFNRITSAREKTCLLGLYKGLVFSGLTIEELHKLRVESSLVHNIIKVLDEMPNERRAEDFPWLSNQAYTLERLSLPKTKTMSPAQKGSHMNQLVWAFVCFALIWFFYAFGSNDHDLSMEHEDVTL